MPITLDQAQTIVRAALEYGTEQGFQPLTVAVLDPGGALVALGRQDGSGYLRPDLATAKAWGILGMGITNRALAARAADPRRSTPPSWRWPGARSCRFPAACSSVTATGSCSVGLVSAAMRR
jgi:uncharacterized protein GlcG (DUF336 family)